MKLSTLIRILENVYTAQGELNVYIKGESLGWTDRIKTTLDHDSDNLNLLLEAGKDND